MTTLSTPGGVLPAARGFDPITLEVIAQELVAIPNQIDRNITRTAFSAFISEYKDYSVGIVDAEGALISQSRGSLAIFVANALGTAVRDGLAIYGADQIGEGDVIISNHAGTLGQHLNNVVMYTPVRVGPERELVAFFCVLMHWLDIGGIMIGSCSSTTTSEIFQEGLHLRTVRLIEAGRRNTDMFRVIQYNTRFPEMLMGDIEAQIVAASSVAGWWPILPIDMAQPHCARRYEPCGVNPRPWCARRYATRRQATTQRVHFWITMASILIRQCRSMSRCVCARMRSLLICPTWRPNGPARSMPGATAARWRLRGLLSSICFRLSARSMKAIFRRSASKFPTALSFLQPARPRWVHRAT